MKKLFLITLVFLVAGTFVPFAESAEKMPKINWRVQSAFPPGGKIDYKGTHFMGSGMGTFAPVFERVAERTNGKFKIKIYEPGVLYSPKGYYDAVSSGAVEMIYGYGWYYSGHILAGMMDPGIFFMTSSGKQFIPIMFESDWLKVVREAYAKHNIYYLASSAWGGKCFLTNFPVHSMADFKGKLMRGSGPEAAMLKLFGAKVTFVAPAEIYTALQRGTIDGVAYSLSVSAMKKWMEVYKYATWPPFFDPNITNFVANLDAWKALPKVYQDILTEEMMKTSRWTFEVANDLLDEWAVKVAAPKYGVNVTELSKEAQDEMRAIQLPIWEKYAAKDKYCAQLLDIVKKATKAK